MASGSGGSFTPNSSDYGSSNLKCCVAGCSAKALGPSRNMCSVHAREVDERRARAKASGEETPKAAAEVQVRDPAQKTTKARLPLDHGPNSIIPVVRRKTGSSGGVIGPESFYARTNGSTAMAQKRTQDARSPPGHSGGTGPARKKPRLDTEPAAKPIVKKPWDTGFNPRPTTKAPEQILCRTERNSETGGSSKARLPTNKTQRKFAPRIELSYKGPSVTGDESDSPHINESAPRATSQSTASPSSHTKEFAANDSLRAWFQRQKHESANPEQSGNANIISDNKRSFLSTRASFERPTSVGSPSSFVEERRATRADNWAFSSSILDSPPKASTSYFFPPQLSSQSPKPPPKRPSIPQEHLDGWKFVPPPAPTQQPTPAKTISELDFDSLIYGQTGAAPAPIGVSVKKIQIPPPAPKPEPPDEPFFMHIDPRLHWPQPQTEEWYQKKLREIEARGGRKANFGKAAQRMKDQRSKEPSKTFEESLPERIRANPAWVRALKQMHEDELAELQANTSKKRGGQRGSKAGRQGLKRQASTAGPTTPRKG
jgi:hypothetical protein